MIQFKNRILVMICWVSLAIGWGPRGVAAQGPTVPPTSRATVTPIVLSPIVVAPPANSTWTINDLLPKSRMTPFPTKAPGQTFITPPPSSWYQQYQTTPLPSARTGASSSSANSSGWTGNVPNWIDPTYAQTQAQGKPPVSASDANGAVQSPTVSSADNAAAWTDRYLAWKRDAAATGLPAPVAQPMLPAPRDVAPLIFGTGQRADNYFANASRDVNAAVAAYADAPRRVAQVDDANFFDRALGGTIGGQAGGFYDTAPLAQSPIGNATIKTTYERQVTLPIGDRRIPAQFQIPGIVPWAGGQTVQLKTTYDVYETDQGVRNVRVHDPIGAFQYAQDFTVSYPADQTRALDGGFGNAFAMSAFNAARSLMGQSALTQDGRYAQWFPNNQVQNPLTNVTVNAATAQAYGDGWLGILNMGANFFDTAALCANANRGGGPKVMKQLLTPTPEQTLLGDALAVSGYDASGEPMATETLGDALGEAVSGSDLLGDASAEATTGTDLATATPSDPLTENDSGGANTAPDLPAGNETVSVKAVIPPAPPQWTWASQPPFPVVVGQDPTKRGVDVLGQVTLSPCTVIYHHVRIDYWYYCGPGKASCDCTKDNCEVRTTRTEWDTTDYEPDALAAAQVTALLSAKSTQYIQTEMQTTYAGAKVQQGNLGLFPSASARILGQRVGVPSLWSFVSEKIAVLDPGTWDIQAQMRTTGTPHCAPLVDQQMFPSVFSAWLREQRLTK